MKRIVYLLAVLAGLSVVSCYDDSKLQNDISGLKTDVEKLNDEIDALKSIIDAAADGEVIVSVKEIDGGYEIKLSSGETLIIRHGNDGKDGNDGNDGQDGKDGQDGANAEGGSSIFADVIVTDDSVTFVTTDGQTIVMPVQHPLDIIFSVNKENVYVQDEKIVVEYLIDGGTDKNEITVLSDDVEAVVVPVDSKSGYIVAQTTQENEDIELVVLVTDGVSNTIFRTLKYVAGVFSTVQGFEVDAAGGELQVPVRTNMNYKVVIENCNWITAVSGTKAIEVREDVILLNVAANTTGAPRAAEVQILVEGAQYLYSVKVTVYQAAGTDAPDPENPEVLNAVYLAGTYYGGSSAESGYNYYFVLSTNMPEAGSADLPAGTKFFAVDLYSSVPVGDGKNIVPVGEYILDVEDTYLPGTFCAGYSYALFTDEAGNEKEYAYESGKVVVSADKLELTVTLNDGNTYNVIYNGVPDMGSTNDGQNGVGNLTDDVMIMSDNAYIIGECYGDYYGVGMNNYMISVFADAETLSGDSIMFEILSDGDGIVGEYPVLDWYAESIYQCFLPGEYEVEDGYLYPYGSWYMSVTGGMMDGTAYAPLVDGEIVITEADGIYTITLDAYDDNGFNISGVLSGVGEIYDEEGNPMQRQKSQPLSGKKTFGRKSMKIGKPLYIK